MSAIVAVIASAADAVLNVLANHPRVVITLACIALLALGGWSLYRAGERSATDRMQRAAVVIQQHADSAIAGTTAKLTAVKARNDSLRARDDSLQVVVAKRRTSAALVKSRVTLHGDTARVATDTGAIDVPIPDVLSRAMAAVTLTNDSLVIALDRQHEADATLIRGLTQQIALDSTVVASYRKSLAAAEARIAADQAAPKHSRLTWFLAGAGSVAVVIAGVAVAF